MAAYFDATMAAGAEPKTAGNWIMGDISAYLKAEKKSIGDLNMKPQCLAELLALIKDGTISGKMGKELLDLVAKGGSAKDLVAAKGMSQISDESEIEAMIDDVFGRSEGQLAQFRGGKTKLQGYFTGQVMKASGGRVNPALMNQILMRKLNEPQS